MDSIRVLNAQEVRDQLTITMAIEAVESAYAQKHAGSGQAWPLIFHEFEDGVRDMDLKSGNLDGDGIFGLKVISCYKDNPAHGLPVYHSAALAFDFETGMPRAVLNAGPVTSFRTGAAGAVGAKYLARADSRELLVCGTGGLAPYLVASTLAVLPNIGHVTLVNPHHPDGAARRLEAIREDVALLLDEANLSSSAVMEASTDLEGAVRAADVIMCATPSYKPYIRAGWVRPGCHLSCVGADKPGKQEVDEQLLAHAHVVVDDEAQCFSVGECEKAHAAGMLSAGLPEIGAVICGAAAGRTSDGQVTVFDSTGLALQDLATYSRVIAAAEAANAGTTITF